MLDWVIAWYTPVLTGFTIDHTCAVICPRMCSFEQDVCHFHQTSCACLQEALKIWLDDLTRQRGPARSSGAPPGIPAICIPIRLNRLQPQRLQALGGAREYWQGK